MPQTPINVKQFIPGESPFRVKGNGFRGQIDYLEKQVPGGLEAVLGRVGDPALQTYLRQFFLASNWYDVFAFVGLQEAASELLGLDPEVFASQFASHQAARDISGVYRVLLKLATPDMIIARMPKVARQYYDFVELTNTPLKKGSYETTITGVPAACAGMYRASSAAFMIEALTTSGAKDIQVQWLDAKPQPAQHGVAIVTLTRRVSWRP